MFIPEYVLQELKLGEVGYIKFSGEYRFVLVDYNSRRFRWGKSSSYYDSVEKTMNYHIKLQDMDLKEKRVVEPILYCWANLRTYLENRKCKTNPNLN